MSEPDEVGILLAKANRALDSAEILRRHGDYDSTVSRLYYAMFYCAEALLRARGLAFKKHQAVIAAFGQHFAKTGALPQELHTWLRNAFSRRNVSDYELQPMPPEAEVVEIQRQAAEFLRQTRNFLKQNYSGTL